MTASYTYDSSGNLTSVSTPLTVTNQTAIVSYNYTGSPGDVTQMVDANVKTWNYAYDQYGNRNSITDPLSEETIYGYDSVSRLTSMVTPKGNVQGGNPSQYTTTYVSDAFGDITLVTDPLSHTTAYTYDANRNRTQTKTQLTDGPTPTYELTNFTFDHDNELIKTVRNDTTFTQTGYDANGNVATQTDASDPNSTHPMTYTYDALDHLQSMKDGLNRQTSYAYDGPGNLKSLTDASNRTTSYTYDAANQQLAISYSDSLTPGVSFTYDVDGQRLTMLDGTGQSTYAWDSLHRLTQSINGAGATVAYGYDLKGQLTSLTYPGHSQAVQRVWDDAGRLRQVIDWNNKVTAFNPDPNSNPGTVAFPNGVTATYTLDTADRMMAVNDAKGSTQVFGATYTRDAANRVTAENGGADGYNAISQLTSSNGSSYAYDAADRITQAPAGANTANFTYDNAEQLGSNTVKNGGTVVAGPLNYAYDAQGNRTTHYDNTNTAVALTYDQADRLSSYGSSATYRYDGSGLRASKTVSGQTSGFVYDLSAGLPLVLQDSTNSYIYGSGGVPIEEVNASGTFYFATDQLGSTRALTDASGTTVNSDAYDAYGNVTASTGSVPNSLLWAGQYHDSESNFYYLRARYYDPSTAQFISRDPAVATTRQPYAYTYDNPLNLTDPSGLGPFDWALPGGGSLAGGGVAACIFGACEAAVAAAPFVFAAGLGAAIGFEIAPAVSQGIDAADPYLVGAAQWVGSNWLNAKKSKQSGKEAATDIPSWAGQPLPGENGKTYAGRECDAQFGPGNYGTGPRSDYNKLKKYGDRKNRS